MSKSGRQKARTNVIITLHYQPWCFVILIRLPKVRPTPFYVLIFSNYRNDFLIRVLKYTRNPRRRLVVKLVKYIEHFWNLLKAFKVCRTTTIFKYPTFQITRNFSGIFMKLVGYFINNKKLLLSAYSL